MIIIIIYLSISAALMIKYMVANNPKIEPGDFIRRFIVSIIFGPMVILLCLLSIQYIKYIKESSDKLHAQIDEANSAKQLKKLLFKARIFNLMKLPGKSITNFIDGSMIFLSEDYI